MYHLFSGSAGEALAVTDERTGAKLPDIQGGWVYERDIDRKSSDPQLTGPSWQQIEDGIKRQGYFLWSQEPMRDA